MNNPFDLTKKYPNYFNKPLFRICLIIILLAFLYVGFSNGWKNDFALITCPETSLNVCFVSSEELELVGLEFPEGLVLKPGQSVGERPNKAFELFTPFVLIIVAFTFLFNHVLYVMKKEE